jgi:hypothetical protein
MSINGSLRRKDAVQPIQRIACANAEFVVTIDGKPYAGFISREYAEMTVALWSGELDGSGLPVPPHERAQHGWPAARGRRLEIVARASRYR